MDAIMDFLVHWGGAILCLLIGLIFLGTALKDGIKAEEKIAGEDSGQYLMRYPFIYTIIACVIILAGIAAGILAGMLPWVKDAALKPVFLPMQIVIGALFGLLGGFRLRRALVHRVAVRNGEIIVHPARGKSFTTNFKEIRSVKKNSDTETDSSSLVLRTNNREKIEVDNKMTNFQQFAAQVAANVELPNLAKKRKIAGM